MKKISLQYGKEQIEISLPDRADIRTAQKVTPLTNPAEAIRQSLTNPLGTAGLDRLANGKDNAAIVVSDNTRPVPYKGPNGILLPIIEILKAADVKHIKIIVACGAHHPMDETQLREMLGDCAFVNGVEIINHVCTDESMLRNIGSTKRTPEVTINSHYLDAELKILTGVVEPHFMAGFSGGRKAICPGISGQSVTFGFHSAEILNESKACNMLLDGNPCHDEALEIAKMAGADFTVNVTVDSDKKLVGVFSGELEQSHLAAVEQLRTFAQIPLDRGYDVVITQAGDVGMNHYQCAKAALEASRALKPGGKIILVANLADLDPLGGENYKKILKQLADQGAKEFTKTILSDDWTFVPEQWQVQMWAKVFEKLDNAKCLYTCAHQLQTCNDELIPEVNVASKIKRMADETDIDFAQRITQQTIDELTKNISQENVLVLADGPYAVPILEL